MNKMLQTMKQAMIDGFFILLPIGLILMIFDELLGFVDDIVDVLAPEIPSTSFVGVPLEVWTTILLMLLLLIFIGMLSRSAAGKSIGRWLNSRILSSIPGYRMLTTISRQLSGSEQSVLLKSALFNTPAGTWMMAFVIDEHDNGYYSLFVPSAPTPMTGTVQFVPADRVKLLDVKSTEVMDTLMKWGIGSKDLIDLEKYIK